MWLVASCEHCLVLVTTVVLGCVFLMPTYFAPLVGVFNQQKNRLEYTTEMGHSETVFDCRFKPSNSNIMATSSYDNTVKVSYGHSCV